MLRTSRFPFFLGAFAFYPAVGNTAGQIRSEIVNIFLLFTSLLPRAEKGLYWQTNPLGFPEKYLFAKTDTVFVFASVCSSSRHRERLKSDSCVASDQENRHHHHRHTFQPDRLCVVLHQLPSNEQNHNQIMGNDRIEVKNNESLMQYYHLMVVAVKIWSTSG